MKGKRNLLSLAEVDYEANDRGFWCYKNGVLGWSCITLVRDQFGLLESCVVGQSLVPGSFCFHHIHFKALLHLKGSDVIDNHMDFQQQSSGSSLSVVVFCLLPFPLSILVEYYWLLLLPGNEGLV